MTDIEQRIAKVLWNHLLLLKPSPQCGCGRLIVTTQMWPDHVAEVLVSEIGLCREGRTLADGWAAVTTNSKTGETTFDSRPCTRQARYVTTWERDE